MTQGCVYLVPAGEKYVMNWEPKVVTIIVYFSCVKAGSELYIGQNINHSQLGKKYVFFYLWKVPELLIGNSSLCSLNQPV